MKTQIFKQCQRLFPNWSGLTMTDFEMDDPKGFSSFTMGIRSKPSVHPLEPWAVLYRRLKGKENAILDFKTEREVFLTLAEHEIAAKCHHYDTDYRIEAFYTGRTLLEDDLFKPDNLRQIAGELHRFHQLRPASLPEGMFFEMLHTQWGEIARHVLNDQIDLFPENEQILCEELREIYSPETLAKVKRCVPEGELTFCHNDTYHGNIMLLDSGEIKLLDFEFSCLNNKAYDFSNPFAETVMQHKQPEYPYFSIGEPTFGDRELGLLIGFYLDHETFESDEAYQKEFDTLLKNAKDMLPLSDFKYAMAALPLSVEPIQKISFIPYAHQRFKRFLSAYDTRFG